LKKLDVVLKPHKAPGTIKAFSLKKARSNGLKNGQKGKNQV
jgi:hypothetical protein